MTWILITDILAESSEGFKLLNLANGLHLFNPEGHYLGCYADKKEVKKVMTEELTVLNS